MFKMSLSRSLPAALLALSCSLASQAGPADMSFFVTSQGAGKGADFGGLSGADAHCQRLADAAGAGQRTWRAYLSSTAADGAPAIMNAYSIVRNEPWSG